MKSVTNTTKAIGTMVKAEPKTIRTANIDASARLRSWCQLSEKPNVLFEPCHMTTCG